MKKNKEGKMEGITATNSDLKVSVDKLEGPEDWAKWKWQICMVLRAYGLENLVDGTRKSIELPPEPTVKQKALLIEWQRDDAKAASLIASALGRSIAELVLTCNYAKEIWDKLCARFERSSTQRLNMLIETFFRIQRDENEDISTHVARLQKLFVDLNNELMKHKENILSERILNGRILSTLGKDYDNFKDLWDTIPTEDQKLNLLIEKLCAIELRDKNVSTSAFYSSEKPHKKKFSKKENAEKSRRSGLDRAKKKFPCNKCKQLGHWAAECPQNKTDGSNGKSTAGGFAFVTCVLSASAGNRNIGVDRWYCDSGASKHITPSKLHFNSYKQFAMPENVSLGKRGVFMQAHGQGNVRIQVLLNGAWHNTEMKNVLYVPDASAHLFSVKAAARNGFSTTIDNENVIIRDKNGVPAMTGSVTNEMYSLNMRVVRPGEDVQVNLVTATDTLQVYHERFAHQNKQHVKQVLKQMNINVEKGDENFCDGCALGKMHRLPFKQRVDRPMSVGEEIHADVNGPMETMSAGGARYFVCFKDDYSKYRKLFFLKHKSEVHEVLEQFLNEAKTVGHIVKMFRCDGGKEFDNKKVTELLAKRGIECQITSPYTPQQNGAAERENRTIVEAARSMLNVSKLPKSLWAEACNTAAYILNRTGKSSINGKAPYELWYGRETGKLNHLRIFGTSCYVHIPKNFRSKFDNKAIFGCLVGYVNQKDGYRIWIPSQKKVIRSHDVRFKPEVVCNLRNEVEISDCTEDKEELKNNQCNSRTDVIIADSPTERKETNRTDASEEEEEDLLSGGSETVTSQNCEDIHLRRSERLKKKPDEFVCLAVPGQISEYSDLIESKERDQWLKAMNEEIEALKENETWELVERPNNIQVLKNRWVLRLKTSNDGTTRFKARLVAKGYVQKQGIDYEETFSPVVRYDTIRMLLAMAVMEQMKLKQFDVKTAFLNGTLEEDVYMEQPEGFEDGTERVCHLKRSLYGLKQAPRCWNKRFIQFMKRAGFRNSIADSCLFYRKSNENALYVGIYVDDGLVVGNNEDEIDVFMKELQHEFKTTTSSLENFLGIHIRCNTDGAITISQEAYTRRILERFQMAESNAISTPVGHEENKNTDEVTQKVPYRQAVGSLLYLAAATRPDIAYAVNKAARVMDKPTKWDWNKVKRIFRYLRGTTGYSITYRKEVGQLQVFSDADFAGDERTRRSTTGIIAKFAGGAVSWTSQLQKTVALSTTEAEIVAASEGAKELVWLKRLLSELTDLSKLHFPPTLYVDNASTVKLAKNPEYHKRSKHIEIRHFYVRERFLDGDIGLEHISGKEQLADLMTKPLERVRFQHLRGEIGVRECSI